MIPERDTTTVESTVEGHDIGMTIDQSALAHIMNVLTDLYEDPEAAIIREYATNALDSHAEAGQTRPIEVSLPTDLRPLLTIRDFGVGLSHADIENIYSRYGASTKRETNDAVGMLGLGCKSALAYVDQFTLVGIKDGERIMVSISRDESGAGVMTVLESGSTDQHAGAEIIIPAKIGNLLEFKASKFFANWEPGTVLVNGEQPTPTEGWQIDDEFTVVDCESYSRKLHIVMGNVTYPVPIDYEQKSAALQSLPDKKQIIARVPIGMVSFTPSREALQDHPATTAALDQVIATFKDACTHAIRTQIAGATSKPAAACSLIEARAALGPKNVPAALYGGEAIPTVVSAEDLPSGFSLWKNRPVSGYRGSASHREPARQVNLDDAGKRPWIIDYPNAQWSATQRRKLNRYMEHHGHCEKPSEQVVYITDAPAVPMPEWIDGAVTAINWQDVREWKDPKGVSAGGVGAERYAGTYCTYINGGWYPKLPTADLAEIDRRKLYYYVGGKRCEQARRALALLADGAVVVSLPDTRAAKFRRTFPHARDVEVYARKAAQGWFNRLPPDKRAACIIGSYNFGYGIDYSNVAELEPTELDDPDLTLWCEVFRLAGSARLSQKYTERFDWIKFEDGEKTRLAHECENACRKYKLLIKPFTDLSDAREHYTLYANAVYAAEVRSEI
jgi:hypothetical protein